MLCTCFLKGTMRCKDRICSAFVYTGDRCWKSGIKIAKDIACELEWYGVDVKNY
jgi:hypothetical protein